MADDACPLPSRDQGKDAGAVRRMLAGKRIAVVGLSDDPSRPSYGVASYLRSAGKEILPVNPNHQEILGARCYPSLKDVPGPIDVVDVFRRPEFCPELVREAVEIGARGVWLQSGVISPEARKIAQEAGIDFVQDKCIKVEHMFSA